LIGVSFLGTTPCFFTRILKTFGGIYHHADSLIDGIAYSALKAESGFTEIELNK